MTDSRKPILVRCDTQGFVDGDLYVETQSGSAQVGLGLYVLVPVLNEQDADRLISKLRGVAPA